MCLASAVEKIESQELGVCNMVWRSKWTTSSTQAPAYRAEWTTCLSVQGAPQTRESQCEHPGWEDAWQVGGMWWRAVCAAEWAKGVTGGGVHRSKERGDSVDRAWPPGDASGICIYCEGNGSHWRFLKRRMYDRVCILEGILGCHVNRLWGSRTVACKSVRRPLP